MIAERLRKAVLQAAIQGKLTEQLPEDGNARDLLAESGVEKERLIQEGKIKRQKPLPEITEDEVPFEIPENWCWVRLGEVGIWGAGATPNRSNPEYYLNGTIPWLKTGDLNDGIITEIPESITDLAVKETSVKLLPKGAVLIAMYGATIGKLGILGLEATTNQACCACIPFPSVLNWYLFYFLLSHKREFVKKGAGGAQPNISREKIIDTLMPLPPPPEQQRIVAKLKEVLPEIDKLQADEEALTKLQDEFPRKLKNSLLQAAIQGKLTEQLSEDGDAKELLVEIEAEKERLVKEGKIKKQKPLPEITEDETPFEVPGNWCWVRLGEVFHLQAGNFISAAEIFQQPADDLFPCFGGNGKRGYVNRYNREGIYPLVGRQGALCGNINLASGKFYATEHAVAVDTFGGCNPNWAAAFLRALNLNQYATSTAQPGIAVSTINRVLIPLPPLLEQQRIVARLEELLPLCDALEV